MSSKKNTYSNDEIDISELLKQWWSRKKLVFFTTITVTFISLFFLVFNNTVYKNNQKLEFISTSLETNFGEKNPGILDALKSSEYVEKTLEKLSFEIDTRKLIDSLNISQSSEPLTASLKERVLSLSDKDIKSLAIDQEGLVAVIENLNNVSKNLVTIEFYNNLVGLSSEQAKLFIKTLINLINDELIFKVDRESLNLKLIDIESISNFYSNDIEQILFFSSIISSMQKNFLLLDRIYQDLLVNVNISSIINELTYAQKLLFEKSRILDGSSFIMDTLNLEILNKERNINDLKESLDFLNFQKNNSNYSITNLENNNEITKNSTTQLDGEILDKILEIGSILSLNDARIKTVENIQVLQRERNDLIIQKEKLELGYEYNAEETNLDNLKNRVITLIEKNNLAVNQVRNLTQPEKVFDIIRNPELTKLNSIPIGKHLSYIAILTILAFVCISLITILLPKSNRR